MRDVRFLRSDSRCRYISNLSSITMKYLSSEQKGRFGVEVDFHNFTILIYIYAVEDMMQALCSY